MNTYSLNDTLTNVVLESTLEVCEKAPKGNSEKVPTATKHLVRKRNTMVIQRDKINVVESSKTIQKNNDIPKYNMKRMKIL